MTQQSIPHSATLEINERVAAYRRSGRSVLHLGFGEAGLPVLPELVEQLRAAAAQNSYAPVAGSESARTAAAGYWIRCGLETGPGQLLMAPGSKALLYAALAVLDGDVILPVPSWVSYAAQAALTGKRVVGVPIPSGYGGVPDPDLLEDAVRNSGARIVLLTLPDNPTGTLAPDDAIRRICEIADRHGLVIVSDEIYRDLVHDGGGFTGPAAYLPDRTIVTCGLSKSLALGGWRAGFARVPNTAEGRDWRSAMLGIGSEVWSSMAAPVETAAAYALGEPPQVLEYVASGRRLHAAVANAVYDVFRAAGAEVRKPTAGFYLYPALRHPHAASDAELARLLLDEHGVAVLPGAVFGDRPSELRFRVATSLLYGDDAAQRWEALAAPDPCSLPWIAAELKSLRESLAALA